VIFVFEKFEVPHEYDGSYGSYDIYVSISPYGSYEIDGPVNIYVPCVPYDPYDINVPYYPYDTRNKDYRHRVAYIYTCFTCINIPASRHHCSANAVSTVQVEFYDVYGFYGADGSCDVEGSGGFYRSYGPNRFYDIHGSYVTDV